MEELTWLILVIWLILLLFYFKIRKPMVGGTSASIGVFFGLTLIDDANWLGFILVIFNIYVLYDAIISRGTEK